jgi:hypothetical protein
LRQLEQDLIRSEAEVLPERRWYLKQSHFSEKWRTTGVPFTSFRQRYKKALAIASAREILAVGKSYIHAYGMSSQIHFSADDHSSDFDPDEVLKGVPRVGLLCLSILTRCQRLLGVVPEKGVGATIRQIDDDERFPSNLVAGLKEPRFKVGDFVWAQCDICEVIATSKSELGFVAYHVEYLEKPPIPEIADDWFAPWELRLLVERSFMELASTDPELREVLEGKSDSERSNPIRQAVIRLAKAVTHLRAQAAKGALRNSGGTPRQPQ